MSVIGELYSENILIDREELKNQTTDKIEAQSYEPKSCYYGICSECQNEYCTNREWIIGAAYVAPFLFI